MPGRILVAEDEPYIVEAITFLLCHKGYEVTAVEDGAAVIPAIANAKPDLLILDIMLPSANGFEVLSRIRSAQNLRALPVLALTAKGQEADRQRMTELGVDDFVTKPFSNRDLVSRVDRLLATGPQNQPAARN
ncbi:MAG TPA: response regulator [Ferrovibrio sp.]|jgi:DNA-binding response OmpR family regulator|uniref:response regulator transcription factor n=1 Tax=Ferrovibrio sp. TaxID=1917215 RepID=UPI002ED2701F